jgi:hypothetical protein
MVLTARQSWCFPSPRARQVRDTPQEHRQNVGCACQRECGDKTRGEPACKHITAASDENNNRKGSDGKLMRNRLAYDEHKRLRALKVCRPSVVSRKPNHQYRAGWMCMVDVCGRLWLSGKAGRRGRMHAGGIHVYPRVQLSVCMRAGLP